MSYYDHDYVSNSDLKAAIDKYYGVPSKSDNLAAIFEVGTLNHHALLEPHKAERTHKDYLLARQMAQTVLEDSLCQKLIMMHDFRREHEWYRVNRMGFKGVRCKTDGDSRMLSTIFEYKGLSVTTDKAFYEALTSLGYDQSAYWYLNVTGLDQYLIAGASKKNPKLLFKRLIDRDHPLYKSGEARVSRGEWVWKQLGLE
jgi:hypothetical protein